MKNVLLFIVSILLLSLFSVASIVIATEFVIRGKTTSKYYFEVALQVDVLGNVMCQFLFNYLFITKEGYKFGKRGETISSVLGKNQRDETLIFLGLKLVATLDLFELNHCKISITE